MALDECGVLYEQDGALYSVCEACCEDESAEIILIDPLSERSKRGRCAKGDG